MKRLVAAAGLAVPDFAALDDPVSDGRRFAASRDRVVVKPRLARHPEVSWPVNPAAMSWPPSWPRSSRARP